jgi:hypothetical protein
LPPFTFVLPSGLSLRQILSQRFGIQRPGHELRPSCLLRVVVQ